MTEKVTSTEPRDIPYSALAIVLLLGIYLILTSTRYLVPGQSILDAKRILEIMIIGVILILSLLDQGLRKSFFHQLGRLPRWFSLGIVGFLGLGVISSAYNANSWRALAYSLADVYLLAMIVVLALVVAACRSLAGTRFDQLAMLLLALLGLSVGLQELIGVGVTWSAGYQFSYDFALAHFAHPRFFNQLQTWTVPLLAALPLLFPRSRLAVFSCVAVLGLHWYIILMTGARGSALSLLFAFAFALVFIPDSRRLIIKWQSAGIMLGVIIYASMFLGPGNGFEQVTTPTFTHQSTESVNESAEINPAVEKSIEASGPASSPFYDMSLGRPMLNTSGRFALWRNAVRPARQHPVLGIGPMNYACKGPTGREGHPHNFAVQLLNEWGIPAVLLVIGLLLGVLVMLFKTLRLSSSNELSSKPQLRAVLSVSVLAATLHTGLSGLLIMPASQITAVLVCGWLLGLFGAGSDSKSAQAGFRPGFQINIPGSAVLILSLVATGLLTPFAIHELKNMQVYQKQLPSIESARPRFWQTAKVCSNIKASK